MTTLQILTINWTHIFNFIVLSLSFAGFIISYNKYMKRTVDISDLDKLERKMDAEDGKLSNRIDKVENNTLAELRDIKQQNRDILKHLIDHLNRNS